jgi:hypothetical protein
MGYCHSVDVMRQCFAVVRCGVRYVGVVEASVQHSCQGSCLVYFKQVGFQSPFNQPQSVFQSLFSSPNHQIYSRDTLVDTARNGDLEGVAIFG